MTDASNNNDLQVEFPDGGGLTLAAGKPYRILIVGDYAGGEKGGVSDGLANKVVEINGTNFDEVMREARPSLSFTFTDPIAAGNKLAEANLRFSSIKDFDPAVIAMQIGAAAGLLEVREKLVARLLGKMTAAQLTQGVGDAISSDSSLAWLADSLKPASPAKPVDPGTLDKVLSGLDLGDGGAAPSGNAPKSAIGAAVASAAGAGNIPSEEAMAIRRTLGEVDRIVSSWLNAVLHLPDVQQTESIWRSLAFLVKRVDFRKGVRLQLLHAKRSELIARFTSLLIDPVFDEGADAPDLIVIASPFGSIAADMELLDELAQHAASIPCVMLAPASAGFFGVKHAWQVPTLPALVSMFDQWQFAKWKSLRDQSYARLLGVVFGRGLLRQPHGRSETKDLEYNFKEDVTLESSFLWAEGVFAAALAIASSVGETGWPSSMAGYVRGQVDGFTTAMGGKDGKKQYGPSDTQMIQSKIEELAAAGLNAVVGIKDQDAVHVWNGISAARPPVVDMNGMLEISLPYQLFAARLSTLLFDLKPQLTGKSEDDVTRIVTENVRNWLQLDEAQSATAINVQTRPAEGDPSAIELAVTTTPPPNIVPAGIPVVLGFKISK